MVVLSGGGGVRNAVGLTHYKIIKLLRIRSQSGLGGWSDRRGGDLDIGSGISPIESY